MLFVLAVAFYRRHSSLGKCQGSFFTISSEIITFLSSVGTHIPQDFCAHLFPTGEVNKPRHPRESGMEVVSVLGVEWSMVPGRSLLTLTQGWPPSAGAEWIRTLGVIIDYLWISHHAPGQMEKSILVFFVPKIRLWRLKVLLLLFNYFKPRHHLGSSETAV